MDALSDRLGIGARDVVSFVGAGGKTTTMFRVARELRAAGHSVIVTTSTKMAADQRTAGLVVGPSSDDPAKVTGPGLDWIDAVARNARISHVLIEADGARHHNVKAPGPFEPVVPRSTTLVVCLIGATALNRVIEDQAHRPLRVAAAAACSPYDRLTPERAARLLASDIGGRKGVPSGARFVVAITQLAADRVGAVADLRSQLRDDYGVSSVAVEALPTA